MRMLKEPYLDISVGRKFKLPVVERFQFIDIDGRPYTTKLLRAVVLPDGFSLASFHKNAELVTLPERGASLKRYGLEFQVNNPGPSSLLEGGGVIFRAYTPVHRHEGCIFSFSDGREEPLILPLIIDFEGLEVWKSRGRVILGERMHALGIEGYGTYYLQINPVIFPPENE